MTRWLAVLLLLANLALFGRYLMTPSAEPVPPEPVSSGLETGLVLLRELSPDQPLVARAPLASRELPPEIGAIPEPETAAPPQPAATPAAPAVAVDKCYRVASFEDLENAAQIKSLLEKAGAETRPLVVEKGERIRYWVLLPPAPSRAQALAMVERVKRAGVKDYYLIPSGPNRYALSLGVFSTREAARRRMADVASLRIKVRIEDVKYPTKRFAIDLRWSKPGSPPWGELLPAGIEANARECTAP